MTICIMSAAVQKDEIYIYIYTHEFAVATAKSIFYAKCRHMLLCVCLNNESFTPVDPVVVHTTIFLIVIH